MLYSTYVRSRYHLLSLEYSGRRQYPVILFLNLLHVVLHQAVLTISEINVNVRKGFEKSFFWREYSMQIKQTWKSKLNRLSSQSIPVGQRSSFFQLRIFSITALRIKKHNWIRRSSKASSFWTSLRDNRFVTRLNKMHHYNSMLLCLVNFTVWRWCGRKEICKPIDIYVSMVCTDDDVSVMLWLYWLYRNIWSR